jgi:hypothetical protein
MLSSGMVGRVAMLMSRELKRLNPDHSVIEKTLDVLNLLCKFCCAIRRQVDADIARREKEWAVGDQVQIIKRGSHIGKTGVVTDPAWNGLVKILVDGEQGLEGTERVKAYTERGQIQLYDSSREEEAEGLQGASSADAVRRAPYSDAPYSDALHSDALHSDAPYSDAPYSDALHSDALHSDAPHSDALHSDAPYSDALHSDALHAHNTHTQHAHSLTYTAHTHTTHTHTLVPCCRS